MRDRKRKKTPSVNIQNEYLKMVDNMDIFTNGTPHHYNTTNNKFQNNIQLLKNIQHLKRRISDDKEKVCIKQLLGMEQSDDDDSYSFQNQYEEEKIQLNEQSHSSSKRSDHRMNILRSDGKSNSSDSFVYKLQTSSL